MIKITPKYPDVGDVNVFRDMSPLGREPQITRCRQTTELSELLKYKLKHKTFDSDYPVSSHTHSNLGPVYMIGRRVVEWRDSVQDPRDGKGNTGDGGKQVPPSDQRSPSCKMVMRDGYLVTRLFNLSRRMGGD